MELQKIYKVDTFAKEYEEGVGYFIEKYSSSSYTSYSSSAWLLSFKDNTFYTERGIDYKGVKTIFTKVEDALAALEVQRLAYIEHLKQEVEKKNKEIENLSR